MNTIKEKVTAPTAAAIREISVSRVAFQPPPKKRKNAGDDAAGWYKVAYSTFIYYNARWTTSKRNQNFQY